MGKKSRLKQEKKEKNLVKLDLACGGRKTPGFIGVDIVQMDGVDVVHNLSQFPWPWENESVEEIHCSHYVEHVPDLLKFMDEAARILIPGGKMTVIAPYYTSMRATQDPTHVRSISEATFLYFNKGWRDQNLLAHYTVTCDFDFSYSYVMTPEWAARNQEARDFAIRHYWNVVNDIQVVLTKKGAS